MAHRQFEEEIASTPKSSGSWKPRASRDPYGSMRDYSLSPFNTTLQEIATVIFGGRSFQMAHDEDHLIDPDALEAIVPVPKSDSLGGYGRYGASLWDDEFDEIVQLGYY